MPRIEIEYGPISQINFAFIPAPRRKEERTLSPLNRLRTGSERVKENPRSEGYKCEIGIEIFDNVIGGYERGLSSASGMTLESKTGLRTESRVGSRLDPIVQFELGSEVGLVSNRYKIIYDKGILKKKSLVSVGGRDNLVTSLREVASPFFL
ncbi:hypothetical protein EVAR_74374_1 [Eumeta japonica]|uniref:Uncharacterized protein n=1 Tax=Eumeta variegata TaxID=151549 RepID=A0A4C1SFV5_EUMVA|nr:hypothetical protein EVAR_74374_1 [Eumeta japonica]